MKRLLIIIIVTIGTFCVSAQDITGQWNGILKVQATQLRIVFHISQTDVGYSSTMDSPDQGAKGIPVTTTTFENLTLTLKISNLGAEYTGEFKVDSITGIFHQSGLEIPLVLKREMPEKETILRPQEPEQPYTYYSEDVTFPNVQAGLTLAGTLTLPEKEGNFPTVILISGSGPQNRNEEIYGHKPFLIT